MVSGLRIKAEGDVCYYRYTARDGIITIVERRWEYGFPLRVLAIIPPASEVISQEFA